MRLTGADALVSHDLQSVCHKALTFFKIAGIPVNCCVGLLDMAHTHERFIFCYRRKFCRICSKEKKVK